MLDITKFSSVFPSSLQNPYDRHLQHEVEGHRKALDGTLFVDRVMTALGIFKAKLYPPKSDNAVRQLHQQICDAKVAKHHKLSLLFYVLLDYDVAGSRSPASEKFASATGMPRSYRIFMRGLWYMDKQEFKNALEYVAHPSLKPDFADEIIIALLRNEAGSNDRFALAYFYTAQPVLQSSSALELLFGAMTRTSPTEALFFSRTQAPNSREQLFQHWVSSILRDGPGRTPEGCMNELAYMILDAEEEAWLDAYLSKGEGRNLKHAKDTLLIRKIACDRFSEASRQKDGGQWAAVLEGIRHGMEGHVE